MSTLKTHPLHVGYLVVGLVFLGICGTWALHAAGVVDGSDARWLLPTVLLLAGAIGLVAFTAKGLSRSRQQTDAPTWLDAADRDRDDLDDVDSVNGGPGYSA
jgi:hypothetical protein